VKLIPYTHGGVLAGLRSFLNFSAFQHDPRVVQPPKLASIFLQFDESDSIATSSNPSDDQGSERRQSVRSAPIGLPLPAQPYWQ
jgi:hypothetical protein